MKELVIFVGAALAAISGFGGTTVAAGHESIAEGPFAPNWQSLNSSKTPAWFDEAKFGIWAHWGPQCVEGSGDWMARKMYVEGTPQWKYHREHYGHQSEFGFKDILPLFKAEKWEPEKLVAYYKSLGADYFFCLANHHDNFDLWDSKYQPWNAMNMGPKRDIVGEWAKAARAQGLKFGVSFHSDHAWTWYEPSRHYDRTGPKEGVPYDGTLTRADGKGKWWEGYDPQDLYAQNHPESRDSWVDNYGWAGWSWDRKRKAMPSEAFIQNYLDRTFDAVNRYCPDLVYLDTVVLPFTGVTERGLELVAHLFNTSVKASGSQQAVIFSKMLGRQHRPAFTWDCERGTPGKIMGESWQTCSCLGDWHYNTDFYEHNRYKSAAFVMHMLADVVSKNGMLLLSVPLRADGTFDEKEKAILDEFGAWMKVNGEAIKGTKPWMRFGEGPIAAKASGKESGDFNERELGEAGAEEIRFTVKGDAVYAIVFAWPKTRELKLESFAAKPFKAELLGHGPVETREGGVVILPESRPSSLGPVLKIRF